MPTIQWYFFVLIFKIFPWRNGLKLCECAQKSCNYDWSRRVLSKRPHWSKEDCGGKLWFSKKGFAAIIIIIIIINLETIGCGALSLDSICCEQVEMYVHEFVPVSNYRAQVWTKCFVVSLCAPACSLAHPPPSNSWNIILLPESERKELREPGGMRKPMIL